jgi:hypothetical protein
MSNQFGELIKELKRLQDAPSANHLRKALPTVAPRMPGPSTQDMKRLAGRLEMMSKSLGAQNAAPARRRALGKREEFLKSLSTINERISAQIAAGKLTAHEACVLTAKLHHLGDHAHALLAAGGD